MQSHSGTRPALPGGLAPRVDPRPRPRTPRHRPVLPGRAGDRRAALADGRDPAPARRARASRQEPHRSALRAAFPRGDARVAAQRTGPRRRGRTRRTHRPAHRRLDAALPSSVGVRRRRSPRPDLSSRGPPVVGVERRTRRRRVGLCARLVDRAVERRVVRMDPGRRRLRRGRRPPDDPPGPAQRARGAPGRHSRRRRDLPPRRFHARGRDGRVGAHPLPDLLAAGPIPALAGLGARTRPPRERDARRPGRRPRARGPAGPGRLLRARGPPPPRGRRLRRHQRPRVPTRRQRRLRCPGGSRPRMLRAHRRGGQPDCAHVALASARARRGARRARVRPHLRLDPRPPLGVACPRLYDRWRTRIHARLLVDGPSRHAGRPPERP